MVTFLNNIPIKIPREMVFSRLKFAKYKTKVDRKISNLISDMIKEGYSLIEPKVSYGIFDISAGKKTVRVCGGRLIIKSSKLAEYLSNSHKAAFFVCTVGDRVSKRVNEHMVKSELTRAVILDAVGSEAAEALAEKTWNLIKIEALKKGYRALKRISCGYGDWKLIDQPKILKLLKADKIGVKTAKSCIMIPEKSVTACIGLIK